MSRSSLRGASAIAGVGETAMVSDSEQTLHQLVAEAALAAIADAGLRPADIDGVITDDEFSAVGVSANEMIGTLGLTPTFAVQAPASGAGLAYAPMLGAMAFAAGEASAILCFLGIDWGKAEAGVANFSYAGENADRAAFEIPFGFVGTPVFYAAMAQRYRSLYGLRDEQLGEIAVAIRGHGSRHPRAQRPLAITLEEYLDSPYLAEPLRVLDACLRTTGAAAFVLVPGERAAEFPHRPVRMLGAGFSADPTSRAHYWTQRPEYPATRTSTAAARAFEMSGLTPAEIDVALLQDPYTIAVLLQLEACGFCGTGEGAGFVGAGGIAIGGRLPVNTHGGQLSHGYLASVTHIVEAVHQLRGTAPANQVGGARAALVSGLGPGDCGVLVLGSEQA